VIHSFLDFELDEDLFELRHRGKPLEIQARVFATLLCLVRNRGRIITRDELTQSVWKDTVVGDAAISQVVMLARKALGDAGPSPQIIRTIRGRGFRFAPPVSTQREPAATPQTESPTRFDASSIQAVQLRPTLKSATPPAPTAATTRTASEFVGRQEELTKLMQCLDRAGRGRGGLALLEGEPGCGRSSLVRELARRALLRSIDAVWGRAWEAQATSTDAGRTPAAAPAFWPWTAVLRSLVQRHGLERLRALSADAGADLAPILTDFTPNPARDTLDLRDVQVRFRVFSALSRLLRAMSLESGAALLIILEDMHWADAASLQLLQFLSEELVDMPVLIVATLDELAPQYATSLPTMLPWTAPHLHRMQLSGLSENEVELLLHKKLGTPQSEHLARRLHQLSAGNPLILHTLSDRIREDREASDVPAMGSADDIASYPVPDRIVQAVHRHLADLPEHTRRTLSAAAVFGCEFRIPWLAALVGESEAAVVEALAPAHKRWVVRANMPHFGVWRFSHAMVRAALYTELPASERFEWHRRIGALVEDSGLTETSTLDTLAHHYLLAGPGEARDKAVLYGRRAGERAYQAHAYAQAAQQFDRVLELLDISLPQDPAQLYALAMQAAEAFYRAGQLSRASARFNRAADLTDQTQALEQHAHALSMAVLITRGMIVAPKQPTLHARVMRVLSQLTRTPSRARALLLAAAGLGKSQFAERNTTTAEAVQMARQLGDKTTLAWTLNARHCALVGESAPQERLLITAELLSLAQELGHVELALDARLWRVLARIELGQAAQAQHDQHAYVEAARASQSAYHQYNVLALSAPDVTEDEQLAHARELSERAHLIGTQSGGDAASGGCQIGLSDLLKAPFEAARAPRASFA